jgi:chromosome segregation ATPase
MLDDAEIALELAKGNLARMETERDEWRLRYERAGAEVNCLRPRVEALERERRESLTESRLKERDALRSEAAGLARKIAALERALAEARAEGEKWKVHIKGMSHEIERARATAEAMQRARDSAYHDRDIAQAAQREAEERAARLEGELKKEREARAEEKKAVAEAERARRAGKPAVKEGAKT